MDGMLFMIDDDGPQTTETANAPGVGVIFDRLVGTQSRRNVFDSDLFARILANRWHGGLDHLGLDADDLDQLLATYFPTWRHEGMVLATRAPTSRAAPMSDWRRDEWTAVRALLQTHRAGVRTEELWLASIIARACMDKTPLWRGLGLVDPRHLTGVFARHFPSLARHAPINARWKLVLYRLLCAQAGLMPMDCAGHCVDSCEAESVCLGAG